MTCPAGSGSTVQNDAGTRGEKWHKIDTGSSPPVPPEKETAAPLAGGTAAKEKTSDIQEQEYGVREANATWLRLAIEQAHPDDIAALAWQALDDLRTIGPRLDPLGDVEQDARFWADCAPPHELAGYAVAAMDRLADLRLGGRARRRLMVALWNAMPESERAAFIKNVGGRARK